MNRLEQQEYSRFENAQYIPGGKPTKNGEDINASNDLNKTPEQRGEKKVDNHPDDAKTNYADTKGLKDKLGKEAKFDITKANVDMDKLLKGEWPPAGIDDTSSSIAKVNIGGTEGGQNIESRQA